MQAKFQDSRQFEVDCRKPCLAQQQQQREACMSKSPTYHHTLTGDCKLTQICRITMDLYSFITFSYSKLLSCYTKLCKLYVCKIFTTLVPPGECVILRSTCCDPLLHLMCMISPTICASADDQCCRDVHGCLVVSDAVSGLLRSLDFAWAVLRVAM